MADGDSVPGIRPVKACGAEQGSSLFMVEAPITFILATEVWDEVLPSGSNPI